MEKALIKRNTRGAALVATDQKDNDDGELDSVIIGKDNACLGDGQGGYCGYYEADWEEVLAHGNGERGEKLMVAYGAPYITQLAYVGNLKTQYLPASIILQAWLFLLLLSFFPPFRKL